MNTTTLPEVIDSLIATIRGLTPQRIADHRFDLWVETYDLREVAMGAAGSSFRRFQVERVADIEADPVLDAEANHFGAEIEILVAYPTKITSLYGENGLRDLHRTATQDGQLIWTALNDSVNHPLGATVTFPRVSPIDRSSEHVWFQPVVARVHWYEATPIVS